MKDDKVFVLFKYIGNLFHNNAPLNLKLCFIKLRLALDRSVSLRLYDSVLDERSISFQYSCAEPFIILYIRISSCLIRLCSRLSQPSSFLVPWIEHRTIALLLPGLPGTAISVTYLRLRQISYSTKYHNSRIMVRLELCRW